MSNGAHGSRKPVVVGVDGSADALRAVDYAVQEALRAQCGIRLVHAQHVPLPPMATLLSAQSLDRTGTRVITEAVAAAQRSTDEQLEIKSVVHAGATVPTLVEAAADARLLVLGHRDLNVLGRIVSGSTVAGVAARAGCPVVSVSEAWQPRQRWGRVIAAVDGSPASPAVLAAAFSAASARDSSLRVMYAWRPPLAYDDLLEPVGAEEHWRSRSLPLMAEILAGWRADYPDVPVEVDLRYERAQDALVHASDTADLLVVGRRGHGTSAAGRAARGFGSMARTLIQHARCPVEVAPHLVDAESPADGAGARPMLAPLY